MQSRPIAALFLDVCGSTGYFERHGEAAGHAMVERCFALLVPEIERHGGRVVKKLGDGILVVFDSAAELVAGAVAAHALLEVANAGCPPEEWIRIHSGGDFGPATFDESGDVFGDTVNVASRVQGIAGRDQIYVTADVVRALPPAEQARARPIGSFPLRGKTEEVEIHEVQWRLRGSTMLVSRADVREEAALSLKIADRVLTLRPDQNRLTIGRVEGSDLVVEDPSVSREHAEVVRRKGALYFIDHSTNGTYLLPRGGRLHHLHHEEFPLEASGRFSLGRPDGPEVEYTVTVEYRIA
jgi:adenylate cyclase